MNLLADRRDLVRRGAVSAALLVLLAAFPAPARASIDIPDDPIDWLLLPPDSILQRGDPGFERAVALCESMGWSEKEFRLREARLTLGDLAGEARRAERQRLAILAVRTGRDREAVDLFDPWNSSDPEVVAAAGLAALRSGRNLDAARLLRAAQALGAPDADLVRYRLAGALRWIPEEDRGLPLFLEIAADPSSRFRSGALHEAALLLFRRGESEEALALLRREYGAGYDKLGHRELIFLVAGAEAAGDEPRLAASLYKKLLERWPEHGRALEAYRALRVLESEGSVPVDPRLPLLGARAAREAGRTEESVQLLQPLLDLPAENPLHTDALVETGKTHYAAERYTSALKTFDRLASLPGEPGRTAILYRARSYKKMGDWSAAIDAYREYVRRYPSSSLAPEVQWEIAWRLKLLGRWDEAAAAFHELPRTFAGSEFAARSPLQEAFCLDAAGRSGDARRVLADFVRRTSKGNTDRDDALFWLGDLGERAGDGESAASAYRELVADHAETYYGLRAAGRLGETAIASPLHVRTAGETDDPSLDWIRSWSRAPRRAAPPAFGDLELYAALGEWAEARREAVSLRKALADDPEGLLAMARLCRSLTLFDNTIRCGRRIQELAEGAGADPVHPYLLALIYPLAWFDVVVSETASHPGLDPFYVLALMRQESWFQPDATSPAGARGLMQIMPATGRHIARLLCESSTFDERDLYAPRVNIRYGVRYLAGLLDRYQGDRLVAASAYNAGESSADLWLAGAGPVESGEFIERINFSETRTYVKRILSGYWICRALYQHLPTERLLG